MNLPTEDTTWWFTPSPDWQWNKNHSKGELVIKNRRKKNKQKKTTHTNTPVQWPEPLPSPPLSVVLSQPSSLLWTWFSLPGSQRSSIRLSTGRRHTVWRVKQREGKMYRLSTRPLNCNLTHYSYALIHTAHTYKRKINTFKKTFKSLQLPSNGGKFGSKKKQKKQKFFTPLNTVLPPATRALFSTFIHLITTL